MVECSETGGGENRLKQSTLMNFIRASLYFLIFKETISQEKQTIELKLTGPYRFILHITVCPSSFNLKITPALADDNTLIHLDHNVIRRCRCMTIS
jgi:hypothetical protein